VDEEQNDKRNILLKILVLTMILVAIGTVWVIKNGVPVRDDAETQTLEPSATSEDATAEKTGFVLEVESIDLAALLSARLPIVIDFGSDSCIPCQQMAPVLQSANADYEGKAIVQFLDVRKYPDAVGNFPVQVIPTQFFINADGTPYVPNEELGVEFILYRAKDTQQHVFTAHQGALTSEELDAILADMGAGK